MALFEPIFDALNRADARYVVVGGVAVVLHGYARLTGDLDLAVDLAPEPARRIIQALGALGLRPAAPVDPETFADRQTRARWIAERGMRVFTMRDPNDPFRQVDLFVEEPIPFEELWDRSERVELEGLSIQIASIPDLIRMKELAGRALDEEDIAELRRIQDRRSR
ncbi:MAG: nucleotidyltransferase [Actinobacteria bacterium]|nr:nucleotidyltransferase [Actinomycetota bacterium]